MGEREFSQPVVKTAQLSKHYTQGNAVVKALDEVSLTVYKGEWVAVTGASGSGKSTLLNMIGLLDTPTSGEVFLNGISTSSLSQKEKTNIRLRKIGFVFQFFNLQTNLTALENVMLPAWLATNDRKKSMEKATSYLERVGLEKRMDHLPSQLSGGQQQKVAIARALVNNPEIILADEPTGNLDSTSTNEILEMFKEVNAMGHTLIMVTHERDIASMADRIITLHDGRIVKEL
ncbi:MAG TPA: ABC transporter ATP-binding protein [Thermoplasmata archaeon]|nr:ABC transporter ATP-binding protein [Thermoplasmata archaeon]